MHSLLRSGSFVWYLLDYVEENPVKPGYRKRGGVDKKKV